MNAHGSCRADAVPAHAASAFTHFAAAVRRRSRLLDPLFWLACLALAALSACGGGGSGSSTPFAGGGSSSANSSSSSSSSSSSGTGGSGDGWVAGVFQPEAQYAARCEHPRTGTDPSTGEPYPDVQGSTTEENFWLRSWTNDLYLWYSEVQDVDPGSYSTTAAYFDILKTTQKTSTGNDKDRFHFTMPTSEWNQFSQAGVDVGYGLTWMLLASSPPRQLYVGYIWPGDAAAAAGLMRGTKVLAIDGVDVENSNDVDTLNQGISPTSAGESHTFTVQDPGSTATRTVTLQAAAVTETPVPIVTTIPTSLGTVGYILFNDHIATAEQELISAIDQLRAANVSDLVLDLRYNGGGSLAIASELAYMIAGPGQASSAYFEKETFNDKHQTIDPGTGQPIAPVPFYNGSSTGAALPYLGLQQVYVLTGVETCSASEAIMNGLNGVNVKVIQIGSTTCGKPYAFYPADNCGTTYFSINMEGVNAKGFGDYPDGFSPQNSAIQTSAVLPGCSVADDFGHALGDPSEGRLAAALAYRAGQGCPTPPTGAAPRASVEALSHLSIHRAPWRVNRILSHRPR